MNFQLNVTIVILNNLKNSDTKKNSLTTPMGTTYKDKLTKQ